MIKRIHIGKEEVNISLFANAMITCISDPKVFTGKHLLLIQTFSKFNRYKINSQKSVALLYTNKENRFPLSERNCAKLLRNKQTTVQGEKSELFIVQIL